VLPLSWLAPEVNTASGCSIQLVRIPQFTWSAAGIILPEGGEDWVPNRTAGRRRAAGVSAAQRRGCRRHETWRLRNTRQWSHSHPTESLGRLHDCVRLANQPGATGQRPSCSWRSRSRCGRPRETAGPHGQCHNAWRV